MNKTTKLFEAIKFATVKHNKQIRKAPKGVEIPYIIHPLEVAEILSECGFDDPEYFFIPAILHDILEDTETEEEEILLKFGKKVLDIIKENTDNPNLDKIKQKEEQIKKMPKKSFHAQVIKIADRTSNLRDIVRIKPNWKQKSLEKYIESSKTLVSNNTLNEMDSCCKKLIEVFYKAYEDAKISTNEYQIQFNEKLNEIKKEILERENSND